VSAAQTDEEIPHPAALGALPGHAAGRLPPHRRRARRRAAHRGDWLLENALAAAAVAVLVATWRRSRSEALLPMIFVFLVLHEIGAHYTYSEVPYDDWFRAVFATSPNDLFGLERNHYDRVVHFGYGLLVAYPMRELFVRIADVRGFWGYMLPLDLVMSTSMVYELIEWGAAEAFGGDLGVAYPARRAIPWDAHKDMLLAVRRGAHDAGHRAGPPQPRPRLHRGGRRASR
jgi:uncharacterized membrane protein YjdF